jgi:hypothetical protein
MSPTLLKIQGAGMPPMLLEECTQLLEAVSLGGLHRTVNGELLYTGAPELMKYRTVCKGKGKVAPGFETLKRGDEVTLHCIQRLWQEVKGTHILLSRPAVEGSVLVMDEERTPVSFVLKGSQEVLLEKVPQKPLYLTYCPLLKMRIVDFKLSMEEWTNVQEWKVDLEEI